MQRVQHTQLYPWHCTLHLGGSMWWCWTHRGVCGLQGVMPDMVSWDALQPLMIVNAKENSTTMVNAEENNSSSSHHLHQQAMHFPNAMLCPHVMHTYPPKNTIHLQPVRYYT